MRNKITIFCRGNVYKYTHQTALNALYELSMRLGYENFLDFIEKEEPYISGDKIDA
jgi:hypothetical protein